MEQIWFKEPTKFINKENYLIFYPSSHMTTKEQYNALLRFSIYFTLIMILISNNYRYIYVVLLTGLITYIMYTVNAIENKKKQDELDKFDLAYSKIDNKYCSKPTKNNPFMNFMVNEYVENPDKYEACNIDNDTIRKNIKKNFNEGLHRSNDDIFSKNASDRQFYTNPNTKVMNDQTGLAEWLYKTPKTCKEDGLQCYKNMYRYAVN
jgi:hypothetical protein